jgi:hypothetical protein
MAVPCEDCKEYSGSVKCWLRSNQLLKKDLIQGIHFLSLLVNLLSHSRLLFLFSKYLSCIFHILRNCTILNHNLNYLLPTTVQFLTII